MQASSQARVRGVLVLLVTVICYFALGLVGYIFAWEVDILSKIPKKKQYFYQNPDNINQLKRERS